MRRDTRGGRLAGWISAVGILMAAGIVLVGCSPATEEPAGPKGPAKPGAAAVGGGPKESPGGKSAEQPETPAPPEAPPVSTFAPAEDLASQVPEYLEDLEEAVESEETYNESIDKIAQRSNTLILVALALGLHDTDNPYKAAAPAMMEAAQQLAAAKDYAAAKAAVEAVKTAAAATDGDSSDLKWERVASMKELMLAVPVINTRLKGRLKSESRLKQRAEEAAGLAAVLAVIAQGSLPNCGETIAPQEVQKWYHDCIHMRDAAAAANAAIRAFDDGNGSFDAAKTIVEGDLNTSCEDCHTVFNPEE
jgi:hypothetical protein